MRYVLDYNLKNGLGHPSVTLYLQGCDKKVKCEGCHNWEMQEENKDDYDIEEIAKNVISDLEQSKPFNKELWLTILGGEPLADYNREITKRISAIVKEHFNSVKIVVYSWRYLSDIDSENLWEYMENIDYGVLGDFQMKNLIKNTLPSTTNQYIYDFKNKCKMKPITV